LEIAKEKINKLLKILKNFVDANRQSVNLKKEDKKGTNCQVRPSDEMVIDEDDLEYTKRTKNLESVEKKKKELNAKKKGMPIYEIK
jgi:uncharacterized membrane protein YgaE (UPF0421/DUF939 family)